MANTFTMILLITTLMTGIFWFFYKIKACIKYFFYTNQYIRKNSDNQRKCTIMEYFSSFFPVLLLVFIIRSFLYEPFQIPSGSMLPTLFIGDFIIVEKFSYGIKNPINHTTFIKNNNPKRGDVVVFSHPLHANVNYIKRIIGLPGDKIKYNIHNKHVTVYTNYKNDNQYDEKICFNYSNIKSSTFIQKIKFLQDNVSKQFQKEDTYNSKYFNIIEEKINNISHNILVLDLPKHQTQKYYQQPGLPKFTWIVPKNQYFVMGDNRDNSLDSRYWGFVPENKLIGKAIKIWMSLDKTENGWPIGIRFNRIGNIH